MEDVGGQFESVAHLEGQGQGVLGRLRTPERVDDNHERPVLFAEQVRVGRHVRQRDRRGAELIDGDWLGRLLGRRLDVLVGLGRGGRRRLGLPRAGGTAGGRGVGWKARGAVGRSWPAVAGGFTLRGPDGNDGFLGT